MKANKMTEFRVALDDLGLQFCAEYLTFHELRREYCVAFNRLHERTDHVAQLADKGFMYIGNFEYSSVTVETYKHKDDLVDGRAGLAAFTKALDELGIEEFEDLPLSDKFFYTYETPLAKSEALIRRGFRYVDNFDYNGVTVETYTYRNEEDL